MEAKELRIGNLVNSEYEGILEVVNINSEGFDYIDARKPTFKAVGRYEAQYLKGIPLTEEWLEKFGFQKRESSVCDAFYIGINPITHDWLFDLVWLKNMFDYSYEGHPFYKNGYHEIKFVHQLQNLYYALTGEELTLKPQ